MRLGLLAGFVAKIKFSKDDFNYFRLQMGGGEVVRRTVSTQYQ
jgi:hypothetical protein